MTLPSTAALTDQRILRIAALRGERQYQAALVLAAEVAHGLGSLLGQVNAMAVVGENLTLLLARDAYGCLAVEGITGLEGGAP